MKSSEKAINTKFKRKKEKTTPPPPPPHAHTHTIFKQSYVQCKVLCLSFEKRSLSPLPPPPPPTLFTNGCVAYVKSYVWLFFWKEKTNPPTSTHTHTQFTSSCVASMKSDCFVQESPFGFSWPPCTSGLSSSSASRTRWVTLTPQLWWWLLTCSPVH